MFCRSKAKWMPSSCSRRYVNIRKKYVAAVKQNGWALQHVPEDKRSKELCFAAVKQNGLAIKYVPEDK